MLHALVMEARALLEAADAVAVQTLSGTKLGVAAAYGYLKHPEAKKTGVLFLHWKDTWEPEELEGIKKKWPEKKMQIATEIPKSWEYSLFTSVHGQFDPDGNDGEPYPNNDPKTVWTPDARKWWDSFLTKLKAVKFNVSDIIVSPKSGLAGFKITMDPPLGALPKYTGKNMKPVL